MSPRAEQSLAAALRDHSAEGVAILTAEPSRLTRAAIYLFLGLLLAGLGWSFFGKADVIVAAAGRLGPESGERRVYAPIDGELVASYVAEGMPVAEGDVLARIDAVGAVEAATRALDAKLKLMDAEQQYEFFPARQKAIEQNIKLLEIRIAAAERLNEKRVSEDLAKLAEEQKLKLERARVQLNQAKNELDQAGRAAEKFERLFRSAGGGGVSRQQVEEKWNEYRAKQTAYRLAEAELAQFEIDLGKEYEQRKLEIQQESEDLLSLYVQRQEKAMELTSAKQAVESQLGIARAAYEGASRVRFEDIDEENFLRISAPVSGVITAVEFTQPGDKVEASKPIAGIAPADARKVLHIEIEEKDRGFLREGMQAKLKFNAFPYQRYGFIGGALEYISPTTALDSQTGKAVYKGRIKLDRDYVSAQDTRFPLRYGMAATAEIVVRQRRLIDLVFDPFRNL